MPSDMRFQCPSEDTPPSTRPPSVASSTPSTSGTPRRSASMDSLQTNLSMDKPVGEEYIPTRMIRASPKANANALQFIKTGPALLHKSAKEQMKKAEVVKSLRKTSLQEEEEWQSTQCSPVSSSSNVVDETSDWQTNLDKWKSGRRKRNEDVLERVIEVKKFEQQEELEGFRGRRKSKTFNEMREEKNRRGRRYNLVVHDDDNNDLSDLGLNVSKNGSSSEPTDDPESTRNADTKSDAGFCTGSDTGSDGVFAEDSISDTSSALGDKREIHDSLESGVSTVLKESELITNGHHVAVPMTITKKGVGNNLEEYTYAKAIEDYKQFAENSVKKRTSSASSTASGGLKDDESVSVGSKKIEDRLSFFDSLEKTPAALKEPRVLRRDRAQPKVDLDKRRSMFELRDLDQSSHQDDNKRRATAHLSSSSLRHKVASFENVNEAPLRARGTSKAPPRDIKFKEKLASFSLKEKGLGVTALPKKSPARDQNFYEKLQNFSRMESGEATSPTDWKGHPRMQTTKAGLSWRSNPPAPLKDRIASFENLSPCGVTSPGRREFSASMENLHSQRSSYVAEGARPLNASQSVSILYPFRRVPPTPFMVIELEEEEDRREEKPCVRVDVLASSPPTTGTSNTTDYEVKSSKQNGVRSEPNLSPTSSSSANMMPQPVSPPQIPDSLPHTVPDHPPPTQSEVLLPLLSPSNHPGEGDSRNPTEIPLGRKPRKLPEVPTVTPQVPDDSPPPVPPPLPIIDNPTDPWVDNSSFVPPLPETPPQQAPTILGMALKSGECQYGSGDIDKVISTYGPQSKAVSLGEENCYQELSPPQLPPEQNFQENVYEKIAEDEPVYENIYEKVADDLEAGDYLDHQYQTLEEVNTQKADISDPVPESAQLPLGNQSPSVIEVLDVTWTEDGCSVPAAPPSHPPPPPPPEEDLGEEEELEDLPSSGVSGPPSTTLPSACVKNEAPRMLEGASISPPPPLVKSSLRKQMSDFLGTKPYVDEEITLQPPPDVSELLRKEREAERLIVQRQSSLSRNTALVDSNFSASLGRPKYTWEDRMKADGPKSKVDLDESSDHLEFQAKLAELEQEMEKHDRHMLQKIKGPHVPSHDLTPDPLPRDETSSLPQYSSDLPKTSSLPQQSMSLPKTSSLSQYSSDLAKTAEDLDPPLFSTSPALSVTPATRLPIQEFYTAPSFTQYKLDNARENDCSSASGGFVSSNNDVQNIYTDSPSLNRSVEAKNLEKVDSVPKGPQQAPPPLPRKSILALSAIPKPRLTDNDSWIMKRKNEPAKRDYSKHWLIQEAEQRRLEQQDRISRPSQLPLNKSTSNTLQSTTGYQNHFQNIKSSFHNISPTSYNSTSFSSNSSTGSSTGSSISNSRSTTAYQNGHVSSLPPSLDISNKAASNTFSSTLPINNVGSNGTSTIPTPTNLKKQTKTYQPPQPSPTGPSKPLPDAIINTITQRVNNKNKMNGSARPTVYKSSSSCPYRADDSYHDYMNTDSFNNIHANDAPIGSSPMLPPSPPQGSSHYLTGGNPSPANASEDQRLLSVSGKKKCSHCGEELGRGAAMIIESLRLFYHIPCFKCCVCGTQLGNGTSGADVRVRNHKLHCHNCYSNDEGMKFSKV